MKNTCYIISLLILSFCFSGCQDFLSQAPKSDRSKDQFFEKPDQIEAAVNALYRDGVPSLYHVEGAFIGSPTMLGGYLSGLYDNEYKGQSAFVQYLQTLTYTPINVSDQLEKVWFKCYQAISKANYIIKYVDVVTDLDEKKHNELLAQTLFFRALNYFYLVRFFGEVPLIALPYESMDNLYMARASQNEVYDLIENDLQKALSYGAADKAFVQNGFRITKGAIETLLADVYLHVSGYPVQGNRYKDASDWAKRVIESGKHILMSHGKTPEESAYNQIRTVDNSTEYIYSYEYNSDTFHNGARSNISLPSIAATWGIFKLSNTTNAYAPTEALLKLFDNVNDLRIQEKQYVHTKYTYVKNGETIVRTFSPAPYFYFEEETALKTGVGQKDVPIYRYAEILLIAAESIAMSEGVTEEAVDYLTQVRSRAYTKMSLDDIKKSLRGLSKEGFVQEVWNERTRELLFEFRIWTDIQRTRKYPIAKNNQGGVEYVNVVGASNPWGMTFQEKNLLFPIPHYEMQRNPSLVQNPGYN